MKKPTPKHIDVKNSNTLNQRKKGGLPKKGKLKIKKSGKYIMISLFIIALINLAFLSVIIYQTFLMRFEQPKQPLNIDEGQTYYSIIDSWQAKAPRFFSKHLVKAYVKFKVNKPLYVGLYQLPENLNLVEFLAILQHSNNAEMVKIRAIEGKTAKDLYQAMLENKDLKIEVLNLPIEQLPAALGIKTLAPQGKFSQNLEGWFAPNTYFYAQGSSDKKILTDLYQNQQRILNREWKSRDKTLPYKTPYEALIMASIIEKETGFANERPLIAGVFINRLRKNMRLQTDPTIIYGMGDKYNGNITKKDILTRTDYNTYKIDGLPPTPIALPSEAAIIASLHPAKTDALFFVATGNGGHKFSKTYAEHRKAVAEYLKVIRDQ